MRRYALAVLALCLVLPVAAFADEPHACCAKRGACDAAKCDAAKCDSAKCDSAKCDSAKCDSAKCDVARRGACEAAVCPSAGEAKACDSKGACPITALLADAVVQQDEEEQCCGEAEACTKCPCSGTVAASDAPCCKVSDCDVASCEDACAGDDDDCPSTATAARIKHLTQAAEHLAAAGLQEEADEILRCAEGLRGKLLEEKLAELARLQAEIRQLQGATAAHQQVKIHVEIVELSLTNLRHLGFDVQSLNPAKVALHKAAIAKAADERPRITLQVCERAEITQLFEAFRRENILKVLASPTLITSDRRPVSFTSGGEVPTAVVRPDKSRDVHFRSVGTQIDAMATLLGGDRVRLDIRPRYCEVDPSLSVKTADGSTVPGFRVHEVDTGCEMRLGQTAVIGGQIQERIIRRVNHDGSSEPHANEVQTLFLVTPELINTLPNPPHTSAQVPQAVRAE